MSAAQPQQADQLSSDGEDGELQVSNSDQWVTRCICAENTQVDGFMIECERCQVWQHGDCVRVDKGKVPDQYFCESCRPDLHDSRGIWIGSAVSSPTAPVAKPTAPKSATSKKKKSKAKKPQAPIDVDPAVVGESAMTDVTNAVPAPGATEEPDEDHKNLSREERKIVKIMQTIQLMEDRDKKRRRSGSISGAAAGTPEGKTQNEKKRRLRFNKNASDSSEPGNGLNGYDVDQLKSCPSLLRKLFPVSPFYLGTKVWLQQYKAESSATATQPLPTPEHLPLKNRLVQQFLSDPSLYSGNSNPNMAIDHGNAIPVTGSLSRSRSPSPFVRKTISSMARGTPPSHTPSSSPASSQPVSPVHHKHIDHDDYPMVTPPISEEAPKQRLSAIPRLPSRAMGTIPKLPSSRAGSFDNSNSAMVPSAHGARMNMFASSAPVVAAGAQGGVTPLSNLSDLMQSYMNAAPESTGPQHIDMASRFKSSIGAPPAVSGGSGAGLATRWMPGGVGGPDQASSSVPFYMTPPPMRFSSQYAQSRRGAPPPPPPHSSNPPPAPPNHNRHS